MQIHRDIYDLPLFKNAVITIGTFDGVHIGHQQIITQLKNEAAKISGETVIITFHPHPKKVIAAGKPIYILNTLSEKAALLAQKQIDHLVVVPFNEEFSNQPAEIYITDFLHKNINPKIITIGYDHRFGKDRQGDYRLLEEYAKRLNFSVKEIPEQVLNKIIVSSTKIREALLCGDIATANSYLGYDYFFEGLVVNGDKIGRILGYPTANLHVYDEEKLIPAHGIYAVNAAVHNQQYNGMMSIGIRPTIGGTKRVIEVNIFNFNENIYDETVRVHIKHYLREEIKFDGLETLKKQMYYDKENAIKILRRYN